MSSGGTPAAGPVVFAYDGSERAKLAIEEAGQQLLEGRDALVLTVWQPFDVGFVPASGLSLDAKQVAEVRAAAEQTADEGALLANGAGFRARSAAVEAAPSWKAIADVADEHDASLIVLGSHGRSGFKGLFIGSVAAALAAHSKRSILIVHRRA
jgi:nucleotide-binding universal stress UspA family protein